MRSVSKVKLKLKQCEIITIIKINFHYLNYNGNIKKLMFHVMLII
jgi:hypothetical protein